ncbi:hypothetical protein PUN28_002933 [Cardiocondyla obscurior]|uniref:Uncharacterized protein n=2 Tax=Cardiocondyla obscurior TaxID=286306 RepID=A0AAW2GWS9_9HYME
MSRKVPSYVSFFLCAIIISAERTSGASDRCTEMMKLDIDEIESHLAELNLTDVPTVKMMTAGFKCPVATLPFGALKSDWARLLLLQEAQPDGSVVKTKLVRLIRILIIAYYQMEERIDVTSPQTKPVEKPVTEKTTVSAAMSQPSYSSNVSAAETSIANTNRCSCTDSSLKNATVGDSSMIKLDAMVIKTATTEGSFNSSATVAVSSDATHQNATLLVDPTATTHYPDDVKKTALRKINKCLRRLFNTAQQPVKIFEPAKTKTKTERAARKASEIDDRGGDRKVIRITPPTNEFWRYVTLPTKALLKIDGVPPANNRLERLKELGAGTRKSRKRMKLSNDVYESFRQFHGVEPAGERRSDRFIK